MVATRLEAEAARELKRLANRNGHSVADELRSAVRSWLLRSKLERHNFLT